MRIRTSSFGSRWFTSEANRGTTDIATRIVFISVNSFSCSFSWIISQSLLARYYKKSQRNSTMLIVKMKKSS
ncbi:hypothetical protein HanXRQr2_Chr05g0197431 [Helianthus annuus]|uniref:Uncharacterized protein n=1 Tax=Helianthus annuus TaxID=4232 RepID=A0A9K3IWK1_HELAN|nr:hypothetical protein HanXRQr2_Chr05g0197421 [Helianthus annuus]KAF5804476.1 hypothetical protein HanXRQr2_Chr05g0197431 [Helianthus annuus]KAJ0575470.1 hypothetical protein HanIR_Chr05g0213081 [Helianthus annuus]KAJ0921374.1 hypothetical protein HanPSC8_Chr05g0190711 [Helianthus annuus]KAJ0921375.1 hypothetical protein HanPSC8_Chr05g0190721 [Helianthus annuus]